MKKSKAMTATGVEGYETWIRSIKERIQRARIKASMLVNSEQTLLYWDIGHDILEKQNNEGWGTKVVDRMSADLKEAFPDMTGWSPRNLKYMRAFADAWRRQEIVQAPLAQLSWYHHLALLERLKSRGDRIAYAVLAIENGWSRDVMVHQFPSKRPWAAWILHDGGGSTGQVGDRRQDNRHIALQVSERHRGRVFACRLEQTDRRIHISSWPAAAGTTSGAVAEASHGKEEGRAFPRA